jgi:hypothetical protein
MSSHGGEKGGFSMSDSEEGHSTLADLLKSTPHVYDKEGQPSKGFTASPSTKLLQDTKDAKEDIAERRRRVIDCQDLILLVYLDQVFQILSWIPGFLRLRRSEHINFDLVKWKLLITRIRHIKSTMEPLPLNLLLL